jgi:hypothetical protein
MLFGSKISWWWWKTREPQFWDLVQWSTAIIRPKSRNSNIRHDGILLIGNFMLMINNHFARFQLPGNLSKTKKKCAPYFRGNTQFPIYFFSKKLHILGINVVAINIGIGWSVFVWENLMRTLIRNNFCSTTLLNFECRWPRLGYKGRKKAKKVEIFQYFGDFSKFEVQKLNICACLTRLKYLNILWWEVSSKIDTQHSNEQISSSWTVFLVFFQEI